MLYRWNFQKPSWEIFWKWKIEKIECTHIINTFPQQVVKDSSRFIQRRALQLLHIFNKNMFAIFFWRTPDGHEPETAAAKWCPRPWIFMDFHEHVQLLGALTPWCRGVWECSDTFLMSTARDLAIWRDLIPRENRHATENLANRWTIFAFLTFRRYVRP